MSHSSTKEKRPTEILFKVKEPTSSTEDTSITEWSSLEQLVLQNNRKKILYEQDLYSPGSGEICTKYITQSDSSALNHVLFKYPHVHDPGIMRALEKPNPSDRLNDDGQDLYLTLCKEMSICPVRLFYQGLLTSEINLSYYGVNPSGVRPMAVALQYNRIVERFNLTDNFLNHDACYHLGQMLYTNATLQELNLTGCRIGPLGLLRLGNYLHINKTLTELNLARNNIEDEGGTHVAGIILNGWTVQRLNLSKNHLEKQTALGFADVFQYRDKITHLDLSVNNLFHIVPTANMLNSLANSTKLQELNLAWNELEGIKVAESIKNVMVIPTLRVLNLSNNKFLGEAISIIVSDLRKAKNLVTLDLSSNPLKPSDALTALKVMLTRRVKLQNLLMANVPVDKTFILVLEVVRSMKSRNNFVVTFDNVLENWVIKGKDARELILKRADYLCNLNTKHKVDLAQFFLILKTEKPFINVKDLKDKVADRDMPLDDELIEELADVFPKPQPNKVQYVNLESLCDFVKRIWPDRLPKGSQDAN